MFWSCKYLVLSAFLFFFFFFSLLRLCSDECILNCRGQLGSTEIDNVDPGSEWWVTSFAPTSTESALFNPVAADTSAHLAATSRQLRYIHRVTESSSLSSSSLLSKSSTSVPQKMLVHSLPAQQLSAYQWSLAYVCHSSA